MQNCHKSDATPKLVAWAGGGVPWGCPGQWHRADICGMESNAGQWAHPCQVMGSGSEREGG